MCEIGKSACDGRLREGERGGRVSGMKERERGEWSER